MRTSFLCQHKVIQIFARLASSTFRLPLNPECFDGMFKVRIGWSFSMSQTLIVLSFEPEATNNESKCKIKNEFESKYYHYIY